MRDKSTSNGAFVEYDHGWVDGRYAALLVPRLVAVRLWSDLIDLDHQHLELAAARAMKFVLRRHVPDGQLDLGGAYSPNEAGFPVSALAEAYHRFGTSKLTGRLAWRRISASTSSAPRRRF